MADSTAHRPRKFVLGVTGASGAAYSLRFLQAVLELGHELHLVSSEYGRRLLFEESNIRNLTLDELAPTLADREDVRKRLFIHPDKDVGAVIASGSFIHSGMAVLPCTSATLGQIATGSGNNLLCRAATVCLKERRRLIICHREMPLSLIDIENMRQATLAGAILCSPNPGFYLHPKRIEDLVDFVVGKVLDLLEIPHSLATRWEATLSRPATTMPSGIAE
jgi:4-hydroxy-3-polyprenylbenzoate decarboxylase